MRATRFLSTTRMTPADVLAALRDDRRQRAAVDPEVDSAGDSGEELTIETPLRRWLRICDLRPIAEQREWLTVWFSIQVEPDEWRAALEPVRQKTVGDLCAFIAARADRPVLRPFPIAGAPCGSAGAFLTLRTMLLERGAPVAGLAPSAPLAPVAQRYWQTIHQVMALLAPGTLPSVQVEQTRAWRCALYAVVTGLGLLLVGLFVQRWSVAVAGAVVVVLASGGLEIAAKHPPAVVRFGELETFADLAQAASRHHDLAT